MDVKALVFSPQQRVQRHLLFWLVWSTLLFVTACIGIHHVRDLRGVLLFDFFATLQATLLNLPFCYLAVYYVAPKYFSTARYALGSLVLLAMVAAYLVLHYFILRLSLPAIAQVVNFIPTDNSIVHWNRAFVRFIQPSGPLCCCAIMAFLRFLKFWYIKQQENATLADENAVAELQLLKAQVHPHFLFNTLNNIYSFTLTKSSQADDLVEKLSDILQYMILEGQKSLVPLQKEIDLIRDYVSLEKVRYGKRLAIGLTVLGNPDNMQISPLLMIPFVENCFKHGSSQLLHNPIINVNITIIGNELLFEAMNNKPLTKSRPLHMANKGGIGLKNVMKRLELLYPDKHSLTIHSSDTMFTVKMRVSLNPGPIADVQMPVAEKTAHFAYANP